MPRRWKRKRHRPLRVDVVVSVHHCALCRALGLVTGVPAPASAARRRLSSPRAAGGWL